jgi:hypothetical protein
MKINRRRDARGNGRMFTPDEIAAEYAAYFALPPVKPGPRDPIAARYALDLEFTRDARGTHDGDSLTEGYSTNDDGGF